MSRRQNQKSKNICLCNAVDQNSIETAISLGAHTLDEVFDETRAGVGACGGSCRPYIKQMIDEYKNTGTFPKIERAKRKKK